MNDPKAPKIRVLIRKRPMNKKQLSRNQTDIISIQKNQTVVVHQQKLKVDLTPYIDEYRFNFDGAYDQFATNEQIYSTAIRPLVDCAFDGAKVSCFAYGQTGSGKTHTMLGNGADVKGLYLLAAIDIFNEIQGHPQLQTWISFYQIYCGKLYDLLNEKNLLFAREDAKSNVNIVGLSQTKIHSAQNLMQLIQYGTSIRVTSQNGTNNDSSRSHAILQITLKKKSKLHGKISFIDLAGSQRAADHADQLQKQTRIDGAEINKSLLALKQCIRALDQNKHHTPFRGSKLTMVLKDSFTGYCRTVMIGNVSPNSASSENTLNTLKYADRVKELKKPSKQSFLQMQKIDQLQKQLMLPRNNIQKKSSKNEQQDSYKEFRENISSNIIQSSAGKVNGNINGNKHNGYEHNKLPVTKKPYNQPMYVNPSMIQGPRTASYEDNRKHSPSIQMGQNVYFSGNGSQTKQQRHSHIERYSTNNYTSPYNNTSSKRQSSNKGISLVQQSEPSYKQPFSEKQLNLLSQKHDEYVQLILQQQQALLKHHQHHINSIIELTKRQMTIKAEADKIGSRIQDYLQNLEQVLDSKLHSIFQLKSKLQQIKQHIHHSKQLEEQYLLCSRSLGLEQQQEDDNIMLLDDDDGNEQLFIN